MDESVVDLVNQSENFEAFKPVYFLKIQFLLHFYYDALV